MPNTAFLFAGQGSQYQGMGGELTALYPELTKIFETGSDILGYDLKSLCQNADAETLAKTENSQPAIFAVSLISALAVRKSEIIPDMVGGHSLGEYAAMVISGILSVEDGFKVIKARAAAMGRCAENQDGGMCAVIGFSPEETAALCEQTQGYVIPVNFNSPVQTVIAGEKFAVNAVAEKAVTAGKRAMPLSVSAAFHSKLMQPAADEFKSAIVSVPFGAPKIDFYSNLTGKKMTDFSDMPSYLAAHLTSPVYFIDELRNMQAAGARRFIECGPGRVLSGLVKKTLDGAEIFNAENEKTLAKLRESL